MINYSVEYVEGNQKALEHFIEKFKIEDDYEGTDAEFLIKEYLNGRGISNDRNSENE